MKWQGCNILNIPKLLEWLRLDNGPQLISLVS
ncbi:hypothetical protein EMIT0194MI4_60155 [Pseudomonas sp. IT-194MI4]